MSEQCPGDARPLVLVVDDDPTARLLVCNALEEEGMATRAVADGAQAVTRFAELRPDLILLDLLMPGMDGYAVCAAIRQMPGGGQVPVSVMTGLDDIDSINRAFECGATDFITKPIHWALLGHRARYLLRAGRAMRAVQQSEDRFRTLTEGAPDAIFLHDRAGRILDVNGAACESLGYSREELLTMKVAQIERHFSEEGCAKLIAQVEATGRCTREGFHRRKDGSRFPVEVRLNRMASAQGPVFLSLARDITERKAAEKELRRSEKRYKKLWQEFQALLDGIPDSITLLDLDRRVVWANRGAAVMLKRPIEELAGRLCHELVQGRPTPCGECAMTLSLASGQAEEGMEKLADGSSWGVKTFPLKDESGRVTRVIRLASDITEKIKLREEAVRSSRLAALGELSAGIAHEINNPNGMILLNLPLFRDIFDDLLPVLDARSAEFGELTLGGMSYARIREVAPQLLSEMLEGARRIKRIVEDLKNFARQGSSEMSEQVDLNAVVETSVRLLANPIKNATRNFSVSYAAGLPLITGNFQRIEQVVINLIHNACQALTDKDQGIFLHTAHDAARGLIIFRVRDEGGGIAAEHLPQVTDPFFTTKRNEGGTGLGLSISVRIVKEHGGRLLIDSTPGKGTAMTLEFSVSKEGANR